MEKEFNLSEKIEELFKCKEESPCPNAHRFFCNNCTNKTNVNLILEEFIKRSIIIIDSHLSNRRKVEKFKELAGEKFA